MPDHRPRYSIVESTVRAHARYGLLIRSSDGEDGYVDGDHIADRPLAPADWPAVGQRLRAVVLGYTEDGRVRLSTAPSYVALAGSTDMAAAMRSWRGLREADERGAVAAYGFLERPDAEAVLRWALTGPYHAADRAVAVRLAMVAPVELRARLAVELLVMVLNDDHASELEEVLPAVGDQRLSLAFPDAVRLAKALTPYGARRLGLFLRRIGAHHTFEQLVSRVLASDDPEVRAVAVELRE